MTGLRQAINAEWVKARRRPAFWVLAVVAIYLAVVQVYVGTSTQYVEEVASQVDNSVPRIFILQGLQPDQLVQALLSQEVQRWILYTIGLVLGAMAAGSDYGWGTIKMELAQGPGRVTIYAGQAIIVLGTLVLMVPLLFAAGLVASVLATVQLHGTLLWPSASSMAAGMGVALLLLVMTASLGLMLASIFRSVALAIAAGLAWLLVFEEALQIFGFSSPLILALESGLPRANADALAESLGQWSAVLNNSPAPIHGPPLRFALVLVVYTIAYLVVGAAVLRRRDVA